ncbi:MAG: YigZ family protein [Chloroflexota bacterium]
MPEQPRYHIPADRHRVEDEIKRSRFITTVAYTPTPEAAREFLAEMRAEFSNASHNCWAYVIGPPGSTGQVGMSDDGEPHGTAGRPMLTVLLHSDVGDITAVVTRYFGGTLLGKGGLVKAYTGGVKLALESLPVIERVPKVDVLVVVSYSTVTPLQRVWDDYEIEVQDEEYAADVTYTLTLPESQLPPFEAMLTELTNGQAMLEVIEG